MKVKTIAYEVVEYWGPALTRSRWGYRETMDEAQILRHHRAENRASNNNPACLVFMSGFDILPVQVPA